MRGLLIRTDQVVNISMRIMDDIAPPLMNKRDSFWMTLVLVERAMGHEDK